MRLDIYLAEKGLAKSRSFAKTLVCDGYVEVNGKICTKVSFDVSEDDEVNVTGKPYEFVGRGGLKLEAAIKAFSANVKDAVAVDIGASTGGFTHCLLVYGAKKVYAVDIGHDQLDDSLRKDDRVINLEGVNARYLSRDDLGELCDVAVSDISFISQTYVIPQIYDILSDKGIYIALIKPQFECGKSKLGKNGIVKDKKAAYEAVKKVVDCADMHRIGVCGLIRSPIEGGDGNTEYLMLCRKEAMSTVNDRYIAEVCGL